MTQSKIKNWLFTGDIESWGFSFSQSPLPWGFVKNYENFFNIMKSGDIAWFYVTKPVGGIIGYGIIKETYKDKSLLWPFEKLKSELRWPLRVRVNVLKAILPEEWKDRKIVINDLKFMKGSGLQILNEETAKIIFERSSVLLGEYPIPTHAGANIVSAKVAEREMQYAEPIAPPVIVNKHKEIQNVLAEIGSLQNYFSQLEYPISLMNERKSIDVVWKREMAGVPTYAFEVELSGQIERAIARLKHAFTNWNSRSRIIIPNEMLDKIKNQISIEDKSFREQIKFYNLDQVANLHKSKIALRDLEKNLELY